MSCTTICRCLTCKESVYVSFHTLCCLFQHDALFQRIYHQCWEWLLLHHIESPKRKKLQFLVCATTSARSPLNDRFWEEEELITISKARCDHAVPYGSKFLVTTEFLSAFPTTLGAEKNVKFNKTIHTTWFGKSSYLKVFRIFIPSVGKYDGKAKSECDGPDRVSLSASRCN